MTYFLPHRRWLASLQVEELVAQVVVDALVKRLADQEGHLVGVLAGGGHTDGAGPVVVQVSELVRESLHSVRVHSHRVIDHVVMRWGHCALAYRLGHQEEVVPVEKYKSSVIWIQSSGIFTLKLFDGLRSISIRN